MFVWSGDPADGPAAIAPFRKVATPLIELAMPMPYMGIYQFTQEAEQRMRAVHRSRFLSTLDDAAIEAMLAAMAAPTSPMTMIQLRVLGGAVGRIATDATAFAHRDAEFMVTIITGFEDPASEPVHKAWTVGLYDALAPNAAGVYSNFLEAEGQERVHEAYPGGTYERLAEIKRRYDPSNLFDQNQNIRPALAMG
jgi:FAD/FMN-containing dehydrogenase